MLARKELVLLFAVGLWLATTAHAQRHTCKSNQKPTLHVAGSPGMDRVNAMAIATPHFRCLLEGFDLRHVPLSQTPRDNLLLLSMWDTRDTPIVQKLKSAGVKNVGVYHIGDETYHQKDLKAFYRASDFVLRRYFDRDRLALAPNGVYVPNGWSTVGTNAGTGLRDQTEADVVKSVHACPDDPCLYCFGTSHERGSHAFAPASQRPLTLNLIVSMCGPRVVRLGPTLFGLGDIRKASEALCQGKGKDMNWREKGLLSQIANGGREVFVDVSGSLEHHKYLDTLRRSTFTLCPGGNNAETYRLWEALQTGSIPIVEHYSSGSQPMYGPRDYLANLLTSVPAGLLPTITDWHKLPNLVESLLSDPVALDERQRRLQEWWAGFKEKMKLDVTDVILKNWAGEC